MDQDKKDGYDEYPDVSIVPTAEDNVPAEDNPDDEYQRVSEEMDAQEFMNELKKIT